jgi:hypothetical protein
MHIHNTAVHLVIGESSLAMMGGGCGVGVVVLLVTLLVLCSLPLAVIHRVALYGT